MFLYSQITGNHRIYGITQDSETKNYIIVRDEICKKCNKICYAIRFQRNFENWTSNNNCIDKFIQDTQLAHKRGDLKKALEWIHYDRFYDIKYIAEGEFGKVYRANWIDGPIDEWDGENENLVRYDQNQLVNLESLNNSKNVTLEFMNEVFLIYFNEIFVI